MNENPELSLLITSIIEQKRYSHCRLCLRRIIDENYATYQDGIAEDNISSDAKSLEHILTKLLGKQFSQEIPGIDAICENCVDGALNSIKFIEKCQSTTEYLHKIVDDLSFNLPTDIDPNTDLYIVCKENGSECIVIEKDALNYEDDTVDCLECDMKFDNIDELNNHTENNHQLYTCNKCQLATPDLGELVTHRNSTNMYKCSKCPTTRCTIDSIEQHVNIIHGFLACKKCGKIFNCEERLLAHEQKHVSRLNKCPHCAKQYLTLDCFNRHVKLCSEGKLDPHPRRSKIKKYICPDCGKGYSTPGGLKVHERFTHGNAEKYQCTMCPKSFTAPSYLKAHMITHSGEKNYCCEMCGGKFVTKEALLYHTRRHTGEKPYSCDMCDEKFVNSSSRADHIKHKHIGPTLSCEVCSRKFVTKNILRLHVQKHYDPSNKLYIGRTTIPPNMPGVENMRLRGSARPVEESHNES